MIIIKIKMTTARMIQNRVWADFVIRRRLRLRLIFLLSLSGSRGRLRLETAITNGCRLMDGCG